jgi:hypothetical protein
VVAAAMIDRLVHHAEVVAEGSEPRNFPAAHRIPNGTHHGSYAGWWRSRNLRLRIHLLRQVLHDPERVGSWLPRLIESWHRGMAGAEAARYEREQAKQKREQQEDPVANVSRQLIKAADGIVELRVVEVEAVGAGDPPDDLVAVTGNFLG